MRTHADKQTKNTNRYQLSLALELVHEVLHHAVIEILTAQMGVASRGLDFENTALDRQQRHIKRTAAQIKDQNVAARFGDLLLVQTVGDGGGCRLVDDALDVETCHGTDQG